MVPISWAIAHGLWNNWGHSQDIDTSLVRWGNWAHTESKSNLWSIVPSQLYRKALKSVTTASFTIFPGLMDIILILLDNVVVSDVCWYNLNNFIRLKLLFSGFFCEPYVIMWNEDISPISDMKMNAEKQFRRLNNVFIKSDLQLPASFISICGRLREKGPKCQKLLFEKHTLQTLRKET